MPIRDLYKTLALTSTLFIIMAAGYLFLFSTIKNRNEDASRLLAEIQTESIREAKLKSLKSTVVETAGAREQLGRYVLGPDEAVLLIERVEDFGSQIGAEVSIQSVQLEPHEGDSGFEWVSLALSAYGGWDQVMGFVSMIESLPYRTQTESLLVSAADGDNNVEWQVKAVVNVLKKK